MDGKDKSVFHQLAGSIVFNPVFEKMEHQNPGHTQTLRSAFERVEQAYPGFSQEFLMGLLSRLGLDKEIDVSETYLRMASLTETAANSRGRAVSALHELENRAQHLKQILGQIPDKIGDRRTFLDVIKQIANAIKDLLESVSIVSSQITNTAQQNNLELQKREFVRYSRRFSNTLKTFFRENNASEVYISANSLVHQTNLILLVVRESTS